MLNAVDVLQKIDRERALNASHLARHFATSPETIQQIFSFLKRNGYLEEVKSECSNSNQLCRFCPMNTCCSKGISISNLKIYHITEKGQQTIRSIREKGGNR